MGIFSRSKVTAKDKKIMAGIDDIRLADMAVELNHWKWPSELPNEEAGDFIENGRRGQLMSYIDLKVGTKLVNRRANKDRMTDEEHEEFWNSNRNLLQEIHTG